MVHQINIAINPVNLVFWPTLFFVIALVLFGMRLQVRHSRRSLAIDDAFLTLGVLFAIIMFSAYMACLPNGLGRHVGEMQIPQLEHFVKSAFLLAEFYNAGLLALKLSIAFMLMRIKRESRTWRYGLWIMIALVTGIFITGFVINIIQCKPISSLWNFFAANRSCMPGYITQDWSWFSQVFGMATDLVFALIPIFFIRTMHKSRRERWTLGVIMGLGLLCTAATIPKLIVLKNFYPNNDFTWTVTDVAFWSVLEVFIGISAICITTLRSRFESAFRAFGIKIRSSSHSKYAGRYWPRKAALSPRNYWKPRRPSEETKESDSKDFDSKDSDSKDSESTKDTSRNDSKDFGHMPPGMANTTIASGYGTEVSPPRQPEAAHGSAPMIARGPSAWYADRRSMASHTDGDQSDWESIRDYRYDVEKQPPVPPLPKGGEV